MTLSNTFPERLLSLRSELGLSQSDMGDKLGLSLNYISSLERGRKEPSAAVVNHVSLLEEAILLGYGRAKDSALREEGARYQSGNPCRIIPVVSWAHAGDAGSYEELPDSWQKQVPTECQDESAFAVELHGDSMEPGFREGDMLILMPNKKAHNGSLVVVRFKNDGVLFRRMELIQDTIRLVPLNRDNYQPTDHHEDEFSWIYPVWGRWTQIWK